MNLFDQTIDTLLKVRSSLYNVPHVGEVYDQQHSDTHLQAVIEIDKTLRMLGVLKSDEGTCV